MPVDKRLDHLVIRQSKGDGGGGALVTDLADPPLSFFTVHPYPYLRACRLGQLHLRRGRPVHDQTAKYATRSTGTQVNARGILFSRQITKPRCRRRHRRRQHRSPIPSPPPLSLTPIPNPTPTLRSLPFQLPLPLALSAHPSLAAAPSPPPANSDFM